MTIPGKTSFQRKPPTLSETKSVTNSMKQNLPPFLLEKASQHTRLQMVWERVLSCVFHLSIAAYFFIPFELCFRFNNQQNLCEKLQENSFQKLKRRALSVLNLSPCSKSRFTWSIWIRFLAKVSRKECDLNEISLFARCQSKMTSSGKNDVGECRIQRKCCKNWLKVLVDPIALPWQ